MANPKRIPQSPMPRAAPVREYVLSTLRDAIATGALLPGQRLIEADLCVQLGVSRPSLREALRQLEAERLVQVTPFKGPSVAEISWDEAKEIYEVRELLEAHAAFLFAQRATDKDVLAMRHALETFERTLTEARQQTYLLSSTKAFYDVILVGCANQVIADVLVGLFARINLLRSHSMSLPGRANVSAHELRQIYFAIEARDPKAARAAAVNHVRNARKAAEKALKAQR